MKFATTRQYLQKNPIVILLVGCTLLIAHVLFAYGGCFKNDDFVYAYYAVKNINTSTPACYLCDHFALRWTAIFFTSIAYNLFGINEFTSALFSLSCFIVTACIVFSFLSKEKPIIILSVFILFFLNYTTIFYSHKLVADTGVLMFNFLAWYFYYRQSFDIKNKVVLNAFIYSCSLFIAMLTKETVVIIFPFWFFLFVLDFCKKRNRQFWLMSIFFCLVFITIYFLYFHFTTHDWLYRYHILQADNFMGGTAFEPYRDEYMGKRLLYGLWQAMLLNGDMQYLLFAIAGLIYHKSIFNNPQKKLLLLSFAVLLVCCNFMSYSFTEYIPLWADPRQFLFIMPFACLTAAYVLEAYMREPAKYPWVLICFVAADLFLFFSELGGTKYVYYGITIALLLRFIFYAYDNKLFSAHAGLILLTAFMFPNFVYDFFFIQHRFFYDEEAVVEKHFKKTNQSGIVYAGDMITTDVGNYFLDFGSEKIRFSNIDTCTAFPLETKFYLLLNSGYNKDFSNTTDSLIVNTDLKQNFKLLDHVNSVKLYEVQNPKALNVLKSYSTSKF